MAGATAGAFIAYAMVKGGCENHKGSEAEKRIAYRTIESPAYDQGHNKYTIEYPNYDSRTVHTSHSKTIPATYISNRTLPPAQAATYGQTYVPQRPHSSCYIDAARSGPIVMIDNDPKAPSHVSSRRTAIRQPEYVLPSPSSPPKSSTRVSVEAPLPAPSQHSRHSKAATSTIGRSSQTRVPSVAPNDSISQVSSRRSSESERAKRHHSSRHGGSRSGIQSARRAEESRGSRAGSQREVGIRDRVEGVVSMIRGSSLKGGR